MSTNTFPLTGYITSDNIARERKGSDGANQRSLFENSIAIAHAESPQSHCGSIAKRKARRIMEEQREREQRGIIIAATSKLQRADDGKRWFVPSQSGNTGTTRVITMRSSQTR